MSLKASVLLLIFCMNDLFISISGVLNSHTIIALLLISPFMSINSCLIYLGAPILSTCMFIIWRRQWRPTPVLLPGKSHGWRSLVGCSPWGHEEVDTTERLHFHFSLSCIGEGNGKLFQCSCLGNPMDRRSFMTMGSQKSQT